MRVKSIIARFVAAPAINIAVANIAKAKPYATMMSAGFTLRRDFDDVRVRGHRAGQSNQSAVNENGGRRGDAGQRNQRAADG